MYIEDSMCNDCGKNETICFVQWWDDMELEYFERYLCKECLEYINENYKITEVFSY